MSKRTKEADPFGDYQTPGWCIDRLLDAAGDYFPSGDVLEPCAGKGRIIERVNRWRALENRAPLRWEAWDIQGKYIPKGLFPLMLGVPIVSIPWGEGTIWRQGDAVQLAGESNKSFGLAITNPPFEHAMKILRALRGVAREVVMLLRVNFLASKERHAYWTGGGMPRAIYQLPDRPKFKLGASDSTEYGWFWWGPVGDRVTTTAITILPLTPLVERKRWEG